MPHIYNEGIRSTGFVGTPVMSLACVFLKVFAGIVARGEMFVCGGTERSHLTSHTVSLDALPRAENERGVHPQCFCPESWQQRTVVNRPATDEIRNKAKTSPEFGYIHPLSFERER